MGLMLAALSGAGQGLAQVGQQALDQDNKIDAMKQAAAIDLNKNMQMAQFSQQLQIGMMNAQIDRFTHALGGGGTSVPPASNPAAGVPTPDASATSTAPAAAGGSLYGAANAESGASSAPAAPTSTAASAPATNGPSRDAMVADLIFNGGKGLGEMYFKAGQPMSKAGEFLHDLGVDPKSPTGMAIMSNFYKKDTYIDPVAVRQGNLVLDPTTHQPIAYNPSVPDGVVPTIQTNASGQTFPVSAAPLSNYPESVGTIAKATQAGKEAGSVFTNVPGPGGSSVSGYGADLFGNQGGATPATAQSAPIGLRNNNPGNLRPGGNFAQYDTPEAGLAALDANLQNYGKQGVNTLAGVISKWAPPSDNNDTSSYIANVAKWTGLDPNQKIDLSNPIVRQQLSAAIVRQENGTSALYAGSAASPGSNASATHTITGPSATDQGIAKSASDAIASAPATIAASMSARTGLQNALTLLEFGAPSGKGVPQMVDMKALLNNLGIPLGAGDVTGYQTMQKYLMNSVNQSAQGTGASGSDARFDSFIHGQPNAETMNPAALNSAIRYVLSQHDAAIARGQLLPAAYQQAQQQSIPNPALAAQQAWANVYKPDYFAFNRMSQGDQAAFLAGLQKQGVNPSSWVQQYNAYGKQTGWVH